MAIKTDIQKDETKAYPKLMISNENLILLCVSLGNGIVLSSTKSSHPIGYHSDAWDMTMLTDFTGTITLTNK